YQDFAMLRGDPSDGLPGVAGIGAKRAAKLLGEFGSVEAVLENLAALPPKQAAAFEVARGYLEAMETVVRFEDDAAVTMTERRAPDLEALAAQAEKHGLGGSATRLTQALTGVAGR
ncbi:MAG: 5'-3' exonuclease H3TH domain-containing protein, partial [Actinomycetota bacterium]